MSEEEPVKMVDVSDKITSSRTAEAIGDIILQPDTIQAIRMHDIKKGDVFTVAEIAGIQAAKRTADVIPLCHQIPLASVRISFRVHEDRVTANCIVKASYTTGVEMEALVGVTTALLSIWDMVKYLEKDNMGQYPTTRLENIRVLRKEKRPV